MASLTNIWKYIRNLYRIMTQDLKKYKLVAGDPEVNKNDPAQVRVKIFRADEWGKPVDKKIFFTVQYANKTEVDEEGIPLDNNFYDVVFQAPNTSKWVDPHPKVSLDDWYKLLDSYAKKWLDVKLSETTVKIDHDDDKEDETVNTSIRVLGEYRILG